MQLVSLHIICLTIKSSVNPYIHSSNAKLILVTKCNL